MMERATSSTASPESLRTGPALSQALVDQGLHRLLQGYSLKASSEHANLGIDERWVKYLSDGKFAIIDCTQLMWSALIWNAETSSVEHVYSGFYCEPDSKLLDCRLHKKRFTLVNESIVAVWKEGNQDAGPDVARFQIDSDDDIVVSSISESYIAVGYGNKIKIWDAELNCRVPVESQVIENTGSDSWISDITLMGNEYLVVGLVDRGSEIVRVLGVKQEAQEPCMLLWQKQGELIRAVAGKVAVKKGKLLTWHAVEDGRQHDDCPRDAFSLADESCLRLKKGTGIASASTLFRYENVCGLAQGVLVTSDIRTASHTYSAEVKIRKNGQASASIPLPMPPSVSRLKGSLFFREIDAKATIIAAIAHPQFSQLQLYTIDLATQKVELCESAFAKESSLALFPDRHSTEDRFLVKLSRRPGKDYGKVSVYDLAQQKRDFPLVPVALTCASLIALGAVWKLARGYRRPF